MAVLRTDRAAGDEIDHDDINAIATQVNTNTTAVGGALQQANNLSDVADVASAVSHLGLTGAVTVASSDVSSRLWIQAQDPDVTNPGAAQDGDVWIFPVA